MKTAILSRKPMDFDLLESLLWENGAFLLLDEHFTRIEKSARYFGVPMDMRAVRERLACESAAWDGAPRKVRLLVSRDAAIRVESTPLPETDGRPVRLGFACTPVDPGNPFLYHKTTCRDAYEKAKATRPDCADVLLWNDQGEVTESTIANIAVRFGDRWTTPARECGLLAGTFREKLLREGTLHEDRLKKTDIVRADEICLINSVRRWMPVQLADILR